MDMLLHTQMICTYKN